MLVLKGVRLLSVAVPDPPSFSDGTFTLGVLVLEAAFPFGAASACLLEDFCSSPCDDFSLG